MYMCLVCLLGIGEFDIVHTVPHNQLHKWTNKMHFLYVYKKRILLVRLCNKF